MQDPFHLDRFLQAQEPIFEQVCKELEAGRKTSHWMWFIFPQMRGLGRSGNAEFYGIASRAEADAYLRHDLLGARLRRCTQLVNEIEGRSSVQIFGSIDSLKFRSSMTLFAERAGDDSAFAQALRKYFRGERDRRTLELLGA